MRPTRHELHVATCPTCGASSDATRPYGTKPTQMGCRGNYEKPHAYVLKVVRVYDLLRAERPRERVG